MTAFSSALKKNVRKEGNIVEKMAAKRNAGQPSKDGAPAAPQSVAAEADAQVLVDDSKLYSPDSERLIVSKALHPTTPEDLRLKLLNEAAADDFYLDQNVNIWRTMVALRNESMACDYTAVMDRAKEKDDFIGGATYLGELLSDPIIPNVELKTIESALTRIKDFSMRRNLLACLNQANLMLRDGSSFAEVSSVIEDNMTDLKKRSESSRRGPELIAAAMDAVLARLEESASGEKLLMSGYPSGFPTYDSATGGLVPGTMIVLAARPSMGKTTLALNMGQHVALRENRPVLVFSLETSNAIMTQRMLSTASRVPMHSIRMGEIEDSWWSRIIEGAEAFRDARIWLDDTPGITMPQIRAGARNFIAANPGGLIIIDYLQIIQGAENDSGDKRALVSNNSTAIKHLARELGAPIVVLSQLNRSVETRTNKRPMMSDLRESGSIEQDADIIMFIYRDEYYNPDSPKKGIAELIIAKNKDGPTTAIELGYQGEIMSFSDFGQAASYE